MAGDDPDDDADPEQRSGDEGSDYNGCDSDEGGSDHAPGDEAGGSRSSAPPPKKELSVEQQAQRMSTAERDRLAGQLRLRGKQALTNRQFEAAQRFLSDAIVLSPKSYKLYRLRSVAHACCHDYASSFDDACIVIQMAPHVSDGYYHKGFALYHLRKFSEAAKAFQEGLNLNPQDRALRQGFWDAVTLLSQDGVAEDSAGKAGSVAGVDVDAVAGEGGMAAKVSTSFGVGRLLLSELLALCDVTFR
eukprot:jgi/Tetstr1/433527/TSEL_022795.t1